MGDETKARHLLADMQARIARGAYDALGISAGDVGPEHVRASFLELTKTFHPAKFARMPTEIQKLANEVFLGLRAAHDQLARPKTAVRQSGPMPFISNKTPAPELVRTPAPVAARPPTGPTTTVRPNAPPAPSAALNPGTQRGVPPAPTGAITPPTQRGTQAPAQARPAITTSQIPVQSRTTTPIARQPGPTTPPAVRRSTPVGGVPIPPTGPRPPITATAASTAKPAASAEPELAGVYDLLQKGQWEPARTTLNALIALQPKPRYKALLQYSFGREAQLARRLDEARVDLQGALEIDPDLQLAKTALAELFTRRK